MEESTGVMKENLVRRYNALFKIKKNEHLLVLVTDYFEYLDKQKILRLLFRELVDDNRISKEVVFMIAAFLIYRRMEQVELNGEELTADNVLKIKPVSIVDEDIVQKFNNKIFYKETIDELRNDLVGAVSDKRNKAKLELIGNSDPDAELFFITKLHNDLLEKLSLYSAGNLPVFNKSKASFNSGTSVLTINESAVSIRKFSNQYHLLKIIFEDNFSLSKEWLFSEIAEAYDEVSPPNDKMFYNAADQIKKKVAIKTHIQNFFSTTSHSIKINSKFI